jgi:hypothetical protein
MQTNPEEALFSFYKEKFPFLKEKVILAVAPRYILPETAVDEKTRLTVPYGLCMQDGIFETQCPFCTWKELSEMVLSGRVEVASYSYSKMNLTFPFVNLEREIVLSKQVLEAHLPQAITTFVFPFGKSNKQSLDLVFKYYGYAMTDRVLTAS